MQQLKSPFIQVKCPMCEETRTVKKDYYKSTTLGRCRHCQRITNNRRRTNDGYVLRHWKTFDKKYWPILSKSSYRGSQIMEHRAVMSMVLNRSLTKNESVHHINGIKNDNRTENLELFTFHHPKGQRSSDIAIQNQELLKENENLLLVLSFLLGAN